LGEIFDVVLTRVVEGLHALPDIAARLVTERNNASRHPAASPAFAILKTSSGERYAIWVARRLAKVQ